MERQRKPALRKLHVPPAVPATGRDLHRPVPQAEVFPRPETEPEEALIVDARSHVRPAQLVERKLVSVLGRGMLHASHVRTTALLAGRPRA